MAAQRLADPPTLTAVGDGPGLYLLHFHPSFRHARHYLGYADDLERRIAQHLRGHSGVSLITSAYAAGVRFTLARVWPGADRSTERRLKGERDYPNNNPHHRGGLGRLCPLCRDEQRKGITHDRCTKSPNTPNTQASPASPATQASADLGEELPF